MGQNQTAIKQNEEYQLIQQLATGNIVRQNTTQKLLFLKQYSYTSQQAYQIGINNHSMKLPNNNPHVLSFLHFSTKSQSSFCSAFYRIIAVYQWIQYTLQNQIQNRISSKRLFTQKQIWSILCSCVLGAVHIDNQSQFMHCGLKSSDIRLLQTGHVKLLHQQMIEFSSNHKGTPKYLAITILQCSILQKISNQDNQYLRKLIEQIQYSNDLKDILLKMINQQCKFINLQQHLFKLVKSGQDSISNTPITKKRGTYKGTKLNGKRHGQGTFHYTQGGHYTGQWKQNKMDGKGVLYYPSGQIAYEGQWKNDMLWGYGILYNQSITPFKTPFDYRDWSLAQQYWVKYQGNFQKDNKHGQGKLFLVNGQRFQAKFQNDMVNGQGILYRDGGFVKGIWKDNILIRIL